MAKAAKPAAADAEPIVLTIDIGGSHVKILTSAGGEMRRAESGPGLTPQQMIASVKTLAEGLSYDVISMGYPGPVAHNRPFADPANLGKGWAGHDFAAAFGKPVKVINDALMQAIGSYEGGRMLFLGLGTGLGAAMIVDNVAQPMELSPTFPTRRAAASRTMSASAGWRSAARGNGANPCSTSSTGFAPPCSPTTSSSAAATSTSLIKCPPIPGAATIRVLSKAVFDCGATRR